MHQGKLNICQPIYASSGSRVSFFTIEGVTSEGLEEVYYMSCLTSLMYSSREMGW